jgi:hypothetical protein
VIGVNFKFFDDSEKVAKAARYATYRAVEKAAYRIFTTSRESIKKAPIDQNAPAPKQTSGRRRKRKTIPSIPGTPPHTRSKHLPNAIVYHASRGEAVIGPRFSRVALSGEAHEFGGKFRGGNYPERSYMRNALTIEAPTFASSFAGSIGA